jgi:glutamate synthase (NADPH/NADH) large chain
MRRGFCGPYQGRKKFHGIVQQALKILENLDHRGAVGADKLMGDGAGILIQLPDALYRDEMAAQGVELPPPGEYGVGMIFLPKEHASRLACEQEMERAIKAEGQVLLGWRDVPVNRDMPMSPAVREKGAHPAPGLHRPRRRRHRAGRAGAQAVRDPQDRQRRHPEPQAQAQQGVLRSQHVQPHRGLQGPVAGRPGGHLLPRPAGSRCVSALGLVHQRFSTNTFPEWPLAHPYRYVAHNGEINTVKGNYNWMKAREGVMSSPVLGADLKKLYPISFASQSTPPPSTTASNC